MSDDYKRLIVVVGPSGAGKDTVLRAWRARLAGDPRIHFARRLITRPADLASEDHVPIGAEVLEALRMQGALAFHWRAHGLAYGVLRSSLACLQQGDWVVLNGSRQHLADSGVGAAGCRIVEITASVESRRTRLADRAREDNAATAGRLQRTAPELQTALTLVNEGELDECVSALHNWWLALRHHKGERQ